jgi:hypothetical protein
VVPSGLPAGTVSSSGQVDYNSITNKLSGVVSSSAQVSPLLPAGTVSSSGQVALASITGTTFANAAFTFPSDLTVSGNLTAKQVYTVNVSSSVIYQSGSTKFGDTTDDVMSVTGSIAVLGGTISGSMVGMFSASSQVDYNSITNKLSGTVSSSAQVTPLLPGGTVSSSVQVDYNSITNKLSGVVSSSAQVAPLLPGGTVSSSTQFKTLTDPFSGSFSGSHTGTFPYASLTSIPSGIFSSSAQLPAGTVSSSGQVDYNSITNKLSGVVSASAQVAPLLPGGTVSSSAQVVAGVAAQTIAPSVINATSTISGSSIQTSGNGTIGGTFSVTGNLTATATASISASIMSGKLSGSGLAYRLVVPVGTNLYAT